MKMLPTLVLAATVVSSILAFSTQDVERHLIMSGQVVPSGSKTYIAGLRTTPDGNSKCGGSLITPTHVISASHCLAQNVRWVSIGSHYRNGTQDGEQIRVRALMLHPNYTDHMLHADDFMVIELERPSKFKPVKLAAADDTDFAAGKWATTMGWGTNAEVNGTYSYELQSVDIQLVSDEACAAYATVDSSMVCAGGVLNHDSCFGDSGSPLVLTPESNSTEDVLVGIVSWSKEDTCGREGYPGVYSRVSNARKWIDSITGGNGTCLGV